jgi:predicted small metal-binding protein
MSDLTSEPKELHCSELGVHECAYVAQGESPAEVVEQFVEHLRSEYGMDLPDVDQILEGRRPADRLMEGRISKEAALVVTRLREKLGIDTETVQEPTEMPGPGVINVGGPTGQSPIP